MLQFVQLSQERVVIGAGSTVQVLAPTHQSQQQTRSHLLVSAAVFAVTAHEELPAGVDVDPFSWDALFAVGHLWWWGVINLIDTRQRHILPALSNVCNVVVGFVGLELAIHQHVWVQAEHLQEKKVTVGLKKVALDLLHGSQAQPARCLVDDVEAHLAVNPSAGRHPSEVVEQGDEQGVLAAVLIAADGTDAGQAGVAADMRQVEELLQRGSVRGLVGHTVHHAMEGLCCASACLAT